MVDKITLTTVPNDNWDSIEVKLFWKLTKSVSKPITEFHK